MAKADGRSVGEYTLVKVLGAGAMGEVWLATHRRLKRSVALKLLHADHQFRGDLIERFRREAAAAMRIAHPGVVRVYDYGDEGGRFYFAMELLEGGSDLAHSLEGGALPPAQALKLVRELLEGVGALHEAGVVHRDLKPANLHLDASGRLRVLDLGLAKHVDRTVLTKEGARVGTPRYMPPEVIHGAAADARSDLYQVGLILHEMLTGDKCFPKGSMNELLAAILAGALAPLPRPTSPTAELANDLCARLVGVDPAERFASAAAALAFVEQAQAARAAERPRRTGSLKSSPPPAQRGVHPTTLSAVALVTIAVIAWQSKRPSLPVKPTPSATAVPRGFDLDVDAGATSLALTFRTGRDVQAFASIEGTGLTTCDPLPTRDHRLRFAGLEPGKPVRVVATTPHRSPLVSWSGVTAGVGEVRGAMFNALASTDDAEARLPSELAVRSRSPAALKATGEACRRRIAGPFHTPQFRRALARFVEVAHRVGEVPDFGYNAECLLVARLERVRGIHFWLLADTGVDSGLPWRKLAPRVARAPAAGAAPVLGAVFGDDGAAAGRKPLAVHPAIGTVPGSGRFVQFAGGPLTLFEARSSWTLDAAPPRGPFARAWAAFRFVSGGPCARATRSRCAG